MQYEISKSHIVAFVKDVESNKFTPLEVRKEIKQWVRNLPDDQLLEWDDSVDQATHDTLSLASAQNRADHQSFSILGGITTIGKLHPEIATILLSELTDSPRSRRQLATALGRIAAHHEHIVDELQSLLEHPAFAVRRAAVHALAAAGVAAEKSALVLIDFLMHAEGEPDYIDEIVNAVGGTGGESQKVYRELVRNWKASDDNEEKMRLDNAISEIVCWSKSAVAWFAQLLTNDPDANVREMAAEAIAHLSSTADVAVELCIGMDDPNRRVRAASCLALLKAATPEAAYLVSLFRHALQDEYTEVRLFALRGLGQIGSAAETAMQDVVAALHNDTKRYNRMEAALALIYIDRHAACQHIYPEVSECISSGTPVERDRASEVFRKLCMTGVPETDMQN